ncbi:hypothetical protein KQX54_006889 [Cotesia glomerata]|uniref:Uncharacterized protein n=1 Tax=Cotesia glomerata TaxID=32391 RepID=A0AAV7II72_COTGL|nr:hypothetical protein KQX54_006889 [Cotesia glomerata]
MTIQNENRALRLKDSGLGLSSSGGGSSGSYVEADGTAMVMSSEILPPPTPDPRVTWNYFDEQGYVSRGGLRAGEDPYARNKFNQEASDGLPSNRDIPDTRSAIGLALREDSLIPLRSESSTSFILSPDLNSSRASIPQP